MANAGYYKELNGKIIVDIPKDDMWKIPVYDNTYDLTRHALDFHQLKFGTNMDYELREELAEAGYA
jgi:hypothetical protein|tara:strand:- start:723 stop:920 length:198 start_codon:yes stop_codon:yes gene_type:complete